MNHSKPTQVAFSNYHNKIRIYTWNGTSIETNEGEVLTESANAYLKRTARGENKKIAALTSKNWEKAARAHADRDGFFKQTSERDLAALTAGTHKVTTEPDFQIVKKWLDHERGCF